MRIVIGMGNEHRQDDGVGLRIAQRVRQLVGTSLTVVEVGGGVDELLDIWEGADKVIIVDAMSGRSPGRIHRIEAEDVAGVPFSGGSTHAMGLAESVRLGRALDRMPGILIIYGVEGESFGHGVGLTPRVAASLEPVAQRIVDEIECMNTPSHSSS